MRMTIKTLVLAPALVLAAACSKDKPADTTLNNDLGLAAQANTARMDSISAVERTNAAAAAAAATPAPVASAPAPAPKKTASAPVHHTTTRRASSSGSSGSRAGRRGGPPRAAPAEDA